PNKSNGLVGRLSRLVYQYDNALFSACQLGDIEKVKYLIEKGASVDAHGKDYYSRYPAISILIIKTPPHWAAIFRVLVEAGAKYEHVLGVATIESTADVLDAMFKVLDSFQPPRQFSKTYLTGSLIDAIRKADLKKIELLLSHGADISGNHLRPLHYAVSLLKIDIVKYLIEKGANVLEKSQLDRYYTDTTPKRVKEYSLEKSATWMAALWVTRPSVKDSLKILKLLLDHGADPNEDGLMARIAAQGHLDVAKALVKYGAHPKTEDLRAGREFRGREGNNTSEALEQPTYKYLSNIVFADEERRRSEKSKARAQRRAEKRLAANG
ncbi:hypothetical protein IFR05_017058, partial [Cadophora sp. M221]